jgi:hypothetical protein
LTSVDAGLIRLPGPDGGDSLFATLGMTTDEAARQPVAGPPGGQPARAVRIGYTYTHEEIRDESDLIRGGVSIPLRDSEGEPIGTLASSGAARSARRPTQSWPRSSSSPRGQDRQSRTRAASVRPASSPISAP